MSEATKKSSLEALAATEELIALGETLARHSTELRIALAQVEKVKAPALLEIVKSAYEPDDGTSPGAQMWDGQWWRPRWGCDTLAAIMERLP